MKTTVETTSLSLTPRFSEVAPRNTDPQAAELARSRARRTQRGPDSVYRDLSEFNSFPRHPTESERIRPNPSNFFATRVPSPREGPALRGAFGEEGQRKVQSGLRIRLFPCFHPRLCRI